MGSRSTIEARSQDCIYVWILVGSNLIRRGSSDVAWTIVVRFVNRSAGKRALSPVFFFPSLSYSFSRSTRKALPDWRCLSASLGKRVLYRTENLLGKFIAETRDSPFVLILETFCNIAIITSRLPLGSYLYLIFASRETPAFLRNDRSIVPESFMFLDLYRVIARVVLSSFARFLCHFVRLFIAHQRASEPHRR